MASFVLDTHDPFVASADGTKIWAAHAGRLATEAPTIVFIPGFASSSLLFDLQFRDEELLSKYSLITYEPRGQGRSEGPSGGQYWTSERFAQDFEAVLKYYGATKVFVAGWSAGCTLSSDIFEHNLGHYVAGLIYLAGMPYVQAFGPVNFPTVAKYYHPLMGDTTGDTLGAAVADFVDICIYQPNRAKMAYTLRSALIGTIVRTPTSVRTAGPAHHVQDPANFLAQAAKYEAVFIVGEKEEVVDPAKMAETYRSIFRRVEVVLVPEAGHTVFWEQAEATKRAIVGFVDRVSRQ